MELPLNEDDQLEHTNDCATRKLVQQVRKLRWLGMNKEARALEAMISRMPFGESVLLLPANTD